MKLTVWPYFLFFLFIWHCEGKSSSFDFFILAQEWPIGVCQTNPDEGCKDPPEWSVDPRWTIHGLWPALYNERGPNYCNNSAKFNINEIKDLVPEMEYDWPSVFADSSETSFWSYEWRKHGTCALSLNSINSQHSYFEAALMAYNGIDIVYETLAGVGITPSQTNTYEVAQINNAIVNEFQVKPSILCGQESIGQVLSEIHFCMDKTFELIDCGSFVYSYSDCESNKPVKYVENISRARLTTM